MRTSLKIIAALAALGGALPQSRAADAIYAESGGVVAVEAEHVGNRTAQTEDPQHHWAIIPTEDPGEQEYVNARGGQYLQVLPNSGDNANVPERVNNPPYADYKVFITTPGLYRLWLRWGGYSGDSDSIYAQIVELKDGTGGTVADWYRLGRNINDATAADNSFDRGWDGNGGFESITGDAGGDPVTWNINNPGVYTIRLTMREDAAAVDTLLLQLSSKADPGNPGPAESAKATTYVAFAKQPADAPVSENTAATFKVEASGSGTLTYQWQKAPAGSSAFTDIPGATSASYTTPNLTLADSGTQYRVNVTTGGLTLPSAIALAILDQTPPGTIGALGGPDLKTVTVRFNEKVSQATAENAANYNVSGLTLSNPKLQANGTDVVLTTTAQTAGTAYTMTISGVKDIAGNANSNVQAKFAGANRIPGGILHKYWENVSPAGSTTVDDLLADSRFPNSPTFTTIEPRAEYPPNGGNEGGSNYGNMLTGWIVPQTTGDYVFFLSADDNANLYLSPDDKSENKKLIAQETVWSNAREWTVSGGASDLSSKRSDEFAGTEWDTGNTITLTANKAYYIEAIHKEGTGGDNVGIAWKKAGDPDPATGAPSIGGQFLRVLADPTAAITITQQPANATAQASTAASFSVAFSAFSAFGTNATVQWQRAPAGSSTFADIAGATGGAYNIAFAAPGDNGAQFRAAITAAATTVFSAAGTLTVSADTLPPSVTSVNGTASSVWVSFNEPLDAPSAANKANYTIAVGVTVNSATVVSASGRAGVVRLDISGATPGSTYNLTVNGVKDLSNNAITSTTRSFTAYNIYANFNDGNLPQGGAVTGPATVQLSGSYDGSAFVELTPAVNSLQGTLIFPDTGTAEVSKFTATWKMYIGQGSGNPADGFSFSLAPDIDENSNFGEEGTGTGLIVSFDTYDNGGGEAPAISVKYGGTTDDTIENGGNNVAKTVVSKATLVNNQWVDVAVQVTADGKVTVIHNNVKYFDNVQIEGWAPITTPRAAFGGRTGGEHEANWVDDFAILYNADIALAQPPTIALTSPADNATFPANSAVTLTVNAQAPGGTVTKVEYLANGQSIGASTTAPYSFTVPSVPTGAYIVSAKVTDARGVTVSSSSIKVVVGNPPKILFVTADPGPLTFPGDQAVYEHMLGRGGYDVELARGADVPEDGSTANGKVLIVQSSSLGSGTVEYADPAGGPNIGKFRDLAIPAIFWEASNWDAFGAMEANPATGTTADQTQINILDASSPLAAGLSAGPVTVVSSPQVFSQGTPTGGHVVASLATDPTQVVIHNYEKGDKGFNGFVMPERRVFFFFQDNTATAANAAGWKLFDAAMDWALHKSGGNGGGTPPSISIARSGGSLTISSSNGGTVQATDTLSPANWQDIGAAPQTVNSDRASRFFRLKK